MPAFPDLLAPKTEATGALKTIGGLKRTSADEGGIQADIVFYWPVRSSGEAKELNSLIAGAGAMFADRDSRDDDDPAKTDFSVVRKFQDDARHMTLNLVQEGTEGGRVVINDQSCAVISARMTTSKKAASFEVKVRIHGLTSNQIGALAEGLGGRVGVSLTTDQGSILAPLVTSNVVALRNIIVPKIGQLVAGRLANGEEFCGMVEEEKDGGFEIYDLDEIFHIDASQVTSAINVSPPKGKTMEWVIETYRGKATKKGNPASWGAILVALGEIHAGNLNASDTWVLSASVLGAAAKVDLTKTETAVEYDEDGEEDDRVSFC